jgi:hypothetical protein
MVAGPTLLGQPLHHGARPRFQSGHTVFSQRDRRTSCAGPLAAAPRPTPSRGADFGPDGRPRNRPMVLYRPEVGCYQQPVLAPPRYGTAADRGSCAKAAHRRPKPPAAGHPAARRVYRADRPAGNGPALTACSTRLNNAVQSDSEGHPRALGGRPHERPPEGPISSRNAGHAVESPVAPTNVAHTLNVSEMFVKRNIA